MSGLESDFDTGLGRESESRKADVSGVATPHRAKRINLGTPATYYFKYMNSGKKNMDISFANDSTGGDTGEISIPGLKLDGTPSKTETSFFSMAGSSTASEGSDDMLNKSTLSDTTELTASNFVLVTTSKQNMIRKNRDSLSRQNSDKENVLNRKNHAVSNIFQPMNTEDNAFVKDKGEKADLKDLYCDTEGKNSDARLQSNVTEEIYTSHQKSSVRGASPSLRSRISSSPTSLRKFHENLKNSRMKRQIQREEDTKRRLSIEGADTLDSMNAQLKALTGEGLFRRERLPPTFTQTSPPQNSVSNSHSRQSSPSGSTTDATATIEMGDLDDLLGMKSSQRAESSLDATADHSLVEHRMENKSSQKSVAQEEKKSSDLPAVNNLDEAAKNSQSESDTKEDKQEYASPTSTPNLNRRKRMTPSKLSSTPRRIVNPDSLFSPARNTRSATKKRKLAEQKQDEPSTEHVVTSKQSSKKGTHLFQVDALTDRDTSMDSESSNRLVEVPHHRKGGRMSPSNDDDTASLGDIANLFGIGKTVNESFESNMSDTSEKINRGSEGQETASLGDINAILNLGVSFNQDSPDRKTCENSQHNNDEPSEVSRNLDPDQNIASLDVDDSKKYGITAGGITSTNESHESLLDVEDSASPNKENSVSTLHSIPHQKSPGLHRTSSHQNLKSKSVDGSQNASKIIPKSPIRLTPNRHLKPTPTKLTPMPRRVMNPNNPNSPARNTRSSRKGKLDDDSKIETNDEVEVGKVLFSNKRRQSVGTRRTSTVGILSSKKKNVPRRSVAFGSPEAAEYNIGSPSVSLTPMPKGRAKALYSLPGFSNLPRDDGRDVGQEKMATDEDVSVGLGMNLLVDKITVEEMNDSPELSPIMKNKADADAYQMSSGFLVPKGITRNEQKVDGHDGRRDASYMGSPSEMKDSSVELTDSESIASINSKCNKYTSDFVVPLHAQRLDFSVASELSENDSSKAEDKYNQKGETTVELEGNMLSLLEAANVGKEEEEGKNRTDDMDISEDSSSLELKDATTESDQFTENLDNIITKAGTEGNETVELEGNMISLLEAASGDINEKENTTDKIEKSGVSEQFMGDIHNIITETGIEGGKTAELESNMLSLLQTTDGGKEEQKNDTTEKMDITGVPEQFTGDIGNIISKADIGGDKTVELEGNMISLLEAASGRTAEENNATEKMDISGTSSSLVLQDNTTETEHFRGDVETETDRDKTIELEGNMFSLLEATRGDKNVKENHKTDKMDITADSTSLALKDIATESDKYTGNLNDVVEKCSVEGEKTVELEGNMLSLLGAAYGSQDGKDSDSNDKMDITEESSSIPVKINATQSEQFTGNLGITEVNAVHSRRNSTGKQLVTEVEGFKSNDLSLRQGSEENCEKDESKSITNESAFSEYGGGRRKRRKSLSSSSFVVDRADEVQSLVDDITSEHKSLVYEKSVSFSDTAEFITTLTTDTAPKPVTEPRCLDISSFTSMLLGGLEFEEKDGDIFSNSFSRFAKADNSVDRIVSERWGQFVEAVCGEVERRIDLEGTAVSSLAEIVEDDPKFYAMLQERLISSQHGGEIKKSMNSLVQAGQSLIEYDWNSWLATVLESFHGPLADTKQIYVNDATKLEETLRHIKKFETDISLMNDIETKLAREKSILRQREESSKLQKEIEIIESQLSATKSTLLQLEEEETNLLKSTRDHQESINNAILYDDLRLKAECSQKNFVSLNGLHSWSMRTVSECGLEFITTGSCQQTHLKLMYEGAESGKAHKILCSKVDSSHTKSKSLYVYAEPLSGFLDTSTKRMMEMAQHNSTIGPVRICEHLQKYTWLAGRLDLIAKEFQVVQRRYNGILHRMSRDLFSFSVEFESERSTVVANFRIESAYYPSFPIEVRLDLMSGEQDLESIKRNLLKNANPGFGSLSRACDIIQSIVRESRK